MEMRTNLFAAFSYELDESIGDFNRFETAESKAQIRQIEIR